MEEPLFLQAIRVNVHHHVHESRGLANAIELCELMARHKPSFRLAAKTWSSILLKMVSVEYPVEQMTAWMDSWLAVAGGDELTKEMIYVLSNALDAYDKSEVVLLLLQHYLNQIVIIDTQRAAVLSYLLRPFLQAKSTTLHQLERYLAFMKTNGVTTTWKVCKLTVKFLLDPKHHEPRRSLTEINAAFVRFLKDHAQVLKWHSNLDLWSHESWENDDLISFGDVVEISMDRLGAEEDESYLSVVYGPNNDPILLYDLAKRRSSCTPVPTDYDLYDAAAFTNLQNPKAETNGSKCLLLSNAVEISQWMASKGFEVPFKTWCSILLRMVEMDYTVDEITQWIQRSRTQEVVSTSVTKSMIYVLSNVIEYEDKIDVFLGLLHYYSHHLGIKEPSKDRRALVQYLFKPFLDSQPTVLQLEKYLQCVASNQTVLMPWMCESIVSFYLDPSRHEPSRALHEIPLGFLDLYARYSSVFKKVSTRDLMRRLGSCVGKYKGSRPTAVAKEILLKWFVDDKSTKKNGKEDFVKGILKELSRGEHRNNPASVAHFVAMVESFGIDSVVKQTPRHRRPTK